MGVLSNSTNSFNALGQPKPPLIISVVQTIFVSLPLAVLGNYLLVFQVFYRGHDSHDLVVRGRVLLA